MGVAAYNRGSRAISQRIDDEVSALKNSGVRCAVAVEHPAPEPPKPLAPPNGYWNLSEDPEPVKVGDRVFCTVTACRGWYEVTEVKGSRSNLRIKTSGFRGWGYGHNFTRTPKDWMTK